ncbi:MAG: adenylate/guanylate cyclase domain-containing protein, partial [Candidatus Nanopelagicales bacterium]
MRATRSSADLGRGRVAFLCCILLLPMLGLALLIARPELDAEWQHQPSHFWLVLSAGAINAVLAYATGSTARLRGDARVFLVSLAFLAAAGFLGLHALATPGVLLPGTNTGFALATPVGLLVAAGFAAASSLNFTEAQARTVVRHGSWLLWALVVAMVSWGVVSIAAIGPFEHAHGVEEASAPLVVLSAFGFVLYAIAVVRYLRLPRLSTSTLTLAMAAAFTLLAEAEVAIAWGRNWHASWWEWHLLMLGAFVLIAVAAHRSWREERWVGLYLEDTASSEQEISVLFADIQGFTRFSEQHEPQQVTAMLNSYFTSAIPPVVQRFGGHIDRIVGDAIMVTFNVKGDQPDHARQAVGAALAIQESTAEVARVHPDWPRFRAGVNTGTAAVGVLGVGGGRTYTVIGDVVNVAARLEG